MFTGVGFCFPRFLHSDYRAIVVVVRAGGEGRLKKYQRKRQKLPLSLPLGPKDADTTTFDALAAECVNPKPTCKQEKDWMSKGTWRLIAKRASLSKGGRKRGVLAPERVVPEGNGDAGQALPTDDGASD
jgi:hypothetical protein